MALVDVGPALEVAEALDPRHRPARVEVPHPVDELEPLLDEREGALPVRDVGRHGDEHGRLPLAADPDQLELERRGLGGVQAAGDPRLLLGRLERVCPGPQVPDAGEDQQVPVPHVLDRLHAAAVGLVDFADRVEQRAVELVDLGRDEVVERVQVIDVGGDVEREPPGWHTRLVDGVEVGDPLDLHGHHLLRLARLRQAVGRPALRPRRRRLGRLGRGRGGAQGPGVAGAQRRGLFLGQLLLHVLARAPGPQPPLLHRRRHALRPQDRHRALPADTEWCEVGGGVAEVAGRRSPQVKDPPPEGEGGRGGRGGGLEATPRRSAGVCRRPPGAPPRVGASSPASSRGRVPRALFCLSASIPKGVERSGGRVEGGPAAGGNRVRPDAFDAVAPTSRPRTPSFPTKSAPTRAISTQPLI